MDFVDAINAHVGRVNDLYDHAKTEEATKTSLIMPLLRVMGYDAFDPRVVIPEYTADVGTKKGEKVDYAIKRGDDIIMLIEAKCVGDPLDASKASQLHRYFHCTPSAKIAILTDGVIYKFFTDLEKTNIMDDKPFMVLDFKALEPALVLELKKLCNDCFDVDIALGAAQDLKYLRQLKTLITKEMNNPSEELVRHFAKQVYSGRITGTVHEEFRDRLRLAFQHNINDEINARLKGAIQPNAYPTKTTEETISEEESTSRDERIITTLEEIEGYHIVKAILCEVVAPSRVAIRDTLSYCGVLLDDNNRKPLCRMHFNSENVKYFETFDKEKNGTKHRIDDLSDIYKYAAELKETARAYG